MRSESQRALRFEEHPCGRHRLFLSSQQHKCLRVGGYSNCGWSWGNLLLLDSCLYALPINPEKTQKQFTCQFQIQLQLDSFYYWQCRDHDFWGKAACVHCGDDRANIGKCLLFDCPRRGARARQDPPTSSESTA